VSNERKALLKGAGLPRVESNALKNGAHENVGFINERSLLARLPISRRTLENSKSAGILPYIKIGRRCQYYWPSVQASLLRRQRGGRL